MDMQTDQNSIMKELSDIKSSLAVNTNETSNIKASITEIKGDIKEIKNDFVARREFHDAITELKEQISPLKKFVYGLAAAVGLTLLGAILRLIIK